MSTLVMTPELEKELRDLGLLGPEDYREKKPKQYKPKCPTLQKGYFNDPRDENGEVPW